MLRYLRRARALAATVHRLEGEVQELRAALQATEGRCQTLLERTRLDALAAERRLQVQSERLGEAMVSLMHERRGPSAPGPDGDAAPDRGARTGFGAR